ncbi:hypothetical protein MYX04_14280, partial [Nitrospiraceae bacterium AH_259_D15_M11_P09]|nr:hypothetical protein [Nitrospiraceae bacterium AH_259_D15_M11_P09]
MPNPYRRTCLQYVLAKQEEALVRLTCNRRWWTRVQECGVQWSEWDLHHFAGYEVEYTAPRYVKRTPPAKPLSALQKFEMLVKKRYAEQEGLTLKEVEDRLREPDESSLHDLIEEAEDRLFALDQKFLAGLSPSKRQVELRWLARQLAVERQDRIHRALAPFWEQVCAEKPKLYQTYKKQHHDRAEKAWNSVHGRPRRQAFRREELLTRAIMAALAHIA